MNDRPPDETGLLGEDRFSDSLAGLDTSTPDTSTPARPDDADESDVIELEAAVPDDARAAPKPRKWEGKRMGHFKLLRLLGEGAMGMVVQAMDTNLDRIVALKILRKRIDGMDQQQGVKQFLREARAAAKIDHPNVAHIYEINEHDGWWYIATEMIEGGTLQQVVQAAGQLPPSAAAPLIADAASALSVAHTVKIIHRDVKPHNLMLTRDGRCKLVDFGLVRLEDPNDPFDFTSRAVGTPHYLPPESADRRAPTTKYDIYSLGATLYYALAGRPPFTADSIPDIVKLHRTAPRPDVREVNPACSEHLAGLVQRAMAIDPDERPNAKRFASELRVESIGSHTDLASLVADPAALQASGLLDSAAGITGFTEAVIGSASSTQADPHATQPLITPASTPAWTWIGRVAAAVVVAGALIAGGGWLVHRALQALTPQHAADAEAFRDLFPDAPESYGLRPAGQFPVAASPPAPAFGWRGRVDPGAAKFVAAAAGRHAYPVDHVWAGLIAPDRAEFFADRAAAVAAGKTPVE